ncbi:Probable methylcrotonoyl-CoA carboxylase beta chain, mitochondrial [Gryllus bimaculatus]|nr:Probable methylcrotonoyl-CoA carboxylase beta chain, mitochondrial [Gryllus bimaculatus]
MLMRQVMVIANDATVKGGTYYPVTVKKQLRAQEIALANALPVVFLVDSGGAHLPSQTDVFPDRDHFGRTFYMQARICTAGGAYVPAMADEAVIVRRRGTIFLAGPPLVRAATGEHALSLARRLVANLGAPAPAPADADAAPAEPPLHDPEELYGIVGTDIRRPYDVREIRANPRHWVRFSLWEAGWHLSQQWSSFLRICSEGCPLCPAVLPKKYPFDLSPEYHSPRFLFMWPNARISVMGPEQAAGVLAQLAQQKREREGGQWTLEEDQAVRAPIQEKFEQEGSPFYSSARVWDDGVIDPADTRTVLGLSLLAATSGVTKTHSQFGVFRM